MPPVDADDVLIDVPLRDCPPNEAFAVSVPGWL
jgi:hypothetical protein